MLRATALPLRGTVESIAERECSRSRAALIEADETKPEADETNTDFITFKYANACGIHGASTLA